MGELRNRRAKWTGLLAGVLVPAVAAAFVLIELPIVVELDPGVVHAFSYEQLGLPNTGFSIRNTSPTTISVEGATTLDSEGLLPGEEAQDGFIILDGTLLLEVEALDPDEGRAITRTTYRMDVARESLQREFLRRALLRQGVVRDDDPVRARTIARARARAMDLTDARIMRFTEPDDGRAGQWVRAIRAIRDGGRADVRFTPRMDPDGTLGHYGNRITSEGESFVWAVLDRNSRYAVGLTVDRDDDGVPNSDDNCIGAANSNQSDLDEDGFGDVCDADDDDDGIADVADNCPLAPNGGQEDFDGDGFGDACDEDADGDNVTDGDDLCLNTNAGAIVDPTGCSLDDLCPCDGEWKNHGAYIKCVSHTANDFADLGLIGDAEHGSIVSMAAQSGCGF